MLPQEIIAKKRDGQALTSTEISAFVTGLTDGSIGDAQAGAFAMAVLLKGMQSDERVALTQAMRDSGDVLSWDLPGPVVDKHSTGGVGDNVSLILAPALAVCGAYVPMISGRGLGGCAIIGQTADIAPADKRLYGIRDVTATVESIDLICASILSKKLAAGLEALVLDVKVGSGAFMSDQNDATELASTLSDIANGAGCKTTALITDMNEPLATAAGNALEVANAVRLLRGDEIDTRLWDVVTALGGALLAASGIADNNTSTERIADALQSGQAAEVFGKMVSALGGPSDFIQKYESHLDHAPIIREVLPQSTGFVSSIELGLGLAADADTPLCRIHARTEAQADQAEARVRGAYHLGPTPPPEHDLIKAQVS